MDKKFFSLDETVDEALRKASKILMLISLPALFVSGYRNLFVDFLPLYHLILTLIWLGFFVASLKNVNLIKIRFNLVILLFLILFLLTGYRNQSFVFVDVFVIIAGGLMAFRQSLFVVLGIMISFVAGLLLIINEAFFPSLDNLDASYGLVLSIHCCALLLSFVLFYTIRNVVENYSVIYHSQLDVNSNLTEENRKSYLRIAEGKETVEEERQRLKLSAFSLSSQMSILEKVVQRAKTSDDPILLGYASTRIEELHKDLLDYSNDGSYISSETKILSVSELAFVVEQYLRPFRVVLTGSTVISVENLRILDSKFEFPTNFIKIICHHLMESCLEELNPKKVLFNFQNVGKKIRNKQQIKMSCLVEFDHGLEDFDFSKFNKSMGNYQIFKKSPSHIAVMKALVDRLSGNLERSLVGSNLEYTLLFWVNASEEALNITNPPKVRDIFGFE